MSDAAVSSLVYAIITIVGMIVGFLTLWVKLKYGVAKAEEAATKATVVENKLDENTRLTKDGTTAAATAAARAETAATGAITAAVSASQENAEKLHILHKIEEQTNGAAESLRALVAALADRVKKLEEYNRDSAHRVLDAVNAMHLKLMELVGLFPRPVPLQPKKDSE